MKSQKQIVLEHLQKFGKITSLDAINMYRITRLSDAIFRLREEGVNIAMERVEKVGASKSERRLSTYGVYSLVKEPVALEVTA